MAFKAEGFNKENSSFSFSGRNISEIFVKMKKFISKEFKKNKPSTKI